MRIRLKPWLFFVLLAAIVALAVLSIERFRYRVVHSDSDLVALLPQTTATRFFVDLDALRRAHVLRVLAATKPAEENDYRQFVQATGFDYTRDADTIAGSADSNQIFIALRGRFDWGRLARYAITHGGSCESSYCKLPTTRPGRWASFRSIQPDVIGLALSADPAAASSFVPTRRAHRKPIPTDPVWIRPAPSLLSDPASLPLPARILAISLQFADEVTLSLGPSTSTSAPFELKLVAVYPSPAMADTTRSQLEIDTKMLKLELAREHQQPNPADLTGLLVSGTFQVVKDEVLGVWPIKQELLNRLQ
ncbi:MAG: hypothetical protein M3Y57_10025 [Acidobacteriota bacterium]|nr:hypothetical protein [Acidobacteriota bacterium]